MSGNAVALTIVVIMFAVVTMVGFAAARWRQAEDRLLLVFAIHPRWVGGDRFHDHFAHHAIAAGDLNRQAGQRHHGIH